MSHAEWETVTKDGLTERLPLPYVGWLYRVTLWDATQPEATGLALTFVPDPQGDLRGGTDAHAWPEPTAQPPSRPPVKGPPPRPAQPPDVALSDVRET